MADILAILNTYSPSTGANIAQLVLYSDGSLGIHGDESMMRHSLGKLVAAPLPAQAAPADLPAHVLRPRSRGRRRTCKACGTKNDPFEIQCQSCGAVLRR